jgi:hypothetical protein
VTAPAEVEVAEVTQADDSNEIRVRLPVVVIEGMDTADGRFLTPGGLTCRALPISLLACPASAHGGQDPEAAQVIGRIDSLTRRPGAEMLSPRTGEPFPEGTFVWSGEGVIQADHPIADLVRRRYLRGVSVDLSGMDVELVGEGEVMADADHPRRRMIAHSAEVSAVTIVPLPAFGDAYVELVGDDEPMTPADPEEFPDGFAASAFPAWRSAEIGDYPPLTAAAGEEHTGGMIALVPDDVDALTVEGGEPADELHLTLAYLGDDVTDWNDAQRAAVLDHVRGWAQDTQPIDGDVMGWALFNPTGANDREPCAVHLVSGDGLPDAKGAMRDHEQSEHPVFLPHITAGYGIDLSALSFIGPVRFSKVRVALGMDVTDYELGAPGDAPATGQDDEVIVAAAPSAKQRAKAEDNSDTYPGTDKFPIDTRDRAASAVKLHGSSDLPAEKVKAWLIRRLKAKGWDDLIPEAWQSSGSHAAQDTAMAADPLDLDADEVGGEPGMPDSPQDCEASGSDAYESEVGPHAAARSLLFDDRKQYAATCSEHDEWAREQIESRGFVVDDVVEIREPDRLDADEETQP